MPIKIIVKTFLARMQNKIKIIISSYEYFENYDSNEKEAQLFTEGDVEKIEIYRGFGIK